MNGTAASSAEVMFLPIGRDVSFPGGVFKVVPDFDERAAALIDALARDGFAYPPPGSPHSTRAGGPAVLAEDAIILPHERVGAAPGFMVRLQTSHVLHLDNPMAELDFRRGDGAFVLHLVAALYGVRLQWSDWWFDKSVPLIGDRHARVTRQEEAAFLGRALTRWRSWPSAQRLRFVAALAMHCKAQCYDWVWEQFSFEYVVFDSLFRTALDLALISSARRIPHASRVEEMCRAFGLVAHADIFELLPRQRNDFVHECLWSAGQADLNPSEEGFIAVSCLRAINHRLVVAMAGGANRYTASDWRWGGSLRFD